MATEASGAEASSVQRDTRPLGHSGSLLCCECSPSNAHLVATSGQDGKVCLLDTRTKDVVQPFECFEQEDVSSITFTEANTDILYAAAGTSIYCLDIRMASSGGIVTKYAYNTEEINQVALNRKGNYLAAADDSGVIKVIDLHSQKLFKTLHGVHTNICSTVKFHPQRPWELISGGLDTKLVKWDFNRGKPLKIVDQGSSTSRTSNNQLCNPPLVHAIAIPEGQLPGEVGKIISAAKGDGVVDIYDFHLENHNHSKSKPKTVKGRDKNEVNEDNKNANASDGDHNSDQHRSAVSCVTFARFSENKPLVISGSNDRYVKLWSCQTAGESNALTKYKVSMVLDIHHKRKVNWVCTAGQKTENIFVADTSRKLSIYTVL